MKQVLDFFTENKIFYLATNAGDVPHVRPLGFVMEWEGKLAFCTSNKKDMYRQMKENPKIEISCVDAEMNTLRICGKAVFVTSEAAQRKVLEVMPALNQLYKVGDGKLEVFCLQDAKATCATMSGEITVLEL